MNESGKAPRIEVQDIDHLGIVAGIVDGEGRRHNTVGRLREADYYHHGGILQYVLRQLR
jgi:aconitase A